MWSVTAPDEHQNIQAPDFISVTIPLDTKHKCVKYFELLLRFLCDFEKFSKTALGQVSSYAYGLVYPWLIGPRNVEKEKLFQTNRFKKCLVLKMVPLSGQEHKK